MRPVLPFPPKRLILPIVPIVAVLSLLHPRHSAADDLRSLGRDFWAWRAIGQPVSGDDVPRILRPAGWVPDWSAQAVAERRRRLEGFEARWRALADPRRPVLEQVDHRL